MNNLLIIGAGGHGRVIADIALQEKKWDKIAFLDDNKYLKTIMDLKIIGDLSQINEYVHDYEMIIGIGNNISRKKIFKELEFLEARIPILIHPNAIIGTEVKLGTGTVVMAGAVINCNCQIGKGCIINTGATVDHDSNIGNFVHISPGTHLAGTVTVGDDTWIGIGVTISNNVTITSGCIIGAGALIIKDIIVSGTYIGVPGKKVN